MIKLIKKRFNDIIEIYKKLKYSKMELYKGKRKLEGKIRLMKKWIYLYQYDLQISQWCKKNDVCSVAIYGMTDIGQMLYYDLSRRGLNIKYTIDKNFEFLNSEVPIFPIKNGLEKVDIVIVTVINPNKELFVNVKRATGSRVITFERILDDLIEEIRF